jgi:hypothetical protein
MFVDDGCLAKQRWRFQPGRARVYYLAMMVLHELTYPSSNYTVGDVIRMGGSHPAAAASASIYEAIGTTRHQSGGHTFTFLVAPACG